MRNLLAVHPQSQRVPSKDICGKFGSGMDLNDIYDSEICGPEVIRRLKEPGSMPRFQGPVYCAKAVFYVLKILQAALDKLVSTLKIAQS